MKKQFFLVLIFLMAVVSSYAQDCCYTTSCTDCFGFDSVLTFDIGGGYRQDKIKWDIFPVYNPGVEIKEEWKHIGTGIIETNAQFLACDHYLFKFDFDWGWFNNSKKQEITFIDLATDTIITDLKAPTRGRVYNIDGSIGYQFNFWCYRFSLTPLVGYSYHFQKLKNSRYRNELTDAELEHSRKNNYRYRWRGPTIGISTALQIECNWQIFFNYTFHWLRYRAKIGDRFAIGSFPGFQKSNNGHGNEFTLGTAHEFCPDWLFVLKVNYKRFEGNKGKLETGHSHEDRVFSPMRELSWESLSATMTVGYIF